MDLTIHPLTPDRRREIVPLDDVPVWAVSCFYVRRGYCGRGVMAALIGEALRAAKRAGAPALRHDLAGVAA